MFTRPRGCLRSLSLPVLVIPCVLQTIQYLPRHAKSRFHPYQGLYRVCTRKLCRCDRILSTRTVEVRRCEVDEGSCGASPMGGQPDRGGKVAVQAESITLIRNTIHGPFHYQAQCMANTAKESERQKNMDLKITQVDLTMITALASFGRMKTMCVSFLILEIEMILTYTVPGFRGYCNCTPHNACVAPMAWGVPAGIISQLVQTTYQSTFCI